MMKMTDDEHCERCGVYDYSVTWRESQQYFLCNPCLDLLEECLMVERPAFCTDEHIDFLNSARPAIGLSYNRAKLFLEDEFPALTLKQVKDIIAYWESSRDKEQSNA